jgi:putative colanic acid biosynthesis UDP-glucose lipid carrier transferase
VELMKLRVDHDLWYIDNWSVWIDIKIIVWTFVKVLVQPSAY